METVHCSSRSGYLPQFPLMTSNFYSVLSLIYTPLYGPFPVRSGSEPLEPLRHRRQPPRATLYGREHRTVYP
jgi:hypothetical protein